MAISTFTITRDSTISLSDPLTVNLAVGGTAVFGVDYTVSGADTFTATTATVVIPAGALSADIIITTVSDAAFESDETVILSIVPTAGVSQLGASPSATFTILNDDATSSSLLLFHFDGANNSTTILDSSGSAVATVSGTAKISTLQSKFGGSSLSLPGNVASFVSISDNPDLELGSGDFTIECFVNLSAVGFFLGKGNASTAAGSAIAWIFGSSCTFYVGGGAFNITTVSPPLNQWSHVAISRQGGTLRYFINGIQQSTAPISGAINNTPTPMQIGSYAGGAVTGYIDEFRLSSTCLYSSNFSPPVLPFN